MDDFIERKPDIIVRNYRRKQNELYITWCSAKNVRIANIFGLKDYKGKLFELLEFVCQFAFKTELGSNLLMT